MAHPGDDGGPMPALFSDVEDSGAKSFAERWAVLFAILLAGAFAMVGALYVLTQIDSQIEAHRVANMDNRTWVLAQLEVDLLNLQNAALRVRDSGGDAASMDLLRLKFDILYSRLNIINGVNSDSVARVQQLVLPAFLSPGGFLERWTPMIDGPDGALVAAMPDLIGTLHIQTAIAREAIVTSLTDVMRASDARRQDLRDTLQRFAVAAFVVLAVMLALIVMVVRQSRARRRRSVQLERSVRNLRATIETSLDGVVVLDHLGRIRDCNRAAEVMFGWQRTEPGAGLETALHPAFAAELRRVRPTAERRQTMTARRRNGSTFPIEVSVAEARGDTPDPFFIAFLRDISERIEREATLEAARNVAQKGEEAKARFLAVMSHEMRTPLNGLMAASDLLQTSTRLDPRQRELSEIIVSCGMAALDQVNNVLELTRLGAADGSSYAGSVFSPAGDVRDLILQHQPQAAKRGNTLECVTPALPGPLVFAQRPLFLRVLYNLIGNAIKFTDQGRITVHLTCALTPDEHDITLTVRVTDTGIGISAADLDAIFRNFETLDASYSRMREGTGLGLGIAKLSAEAMGGHITVESAPGEGSTFTFHVTLPVAEGALPEPPLPEEGPPAPLSILLAEDNAINRQLLAEILTLAGHAVTQAEDGEAAVARAAVRAFDVILMDISMPGLDGVDATRRIRQGGASAQTPVIGVTANADPDRLPEFHAAGMAEVLVKPVARATLFATLARFGSAATPEPADGLVDTALWDDLTLALGRDYIAAQISRSLAETAETLAEMQHRHHAGALAEAGRAAHRAAGGAAVTGLCGLAEALSRYETAARQADDAGASAALDELPVILAATAEAVRAHGLNIRA